MAATEGVGSKRACYSFDEMTPQYKKQKNAFQEVIDKVSTLYGSNGILVLANRVVILPQEKFYEPIVRILAENLREEVREVQDNMDENIAERLSKLENDGYSFRVVENWAEDEALIEIFPYINRTRVDEKTLNYYNRCSHHNKANVLRKFLKKNSKALEEVNCLYLSGKGLKRIPKEIKYLVNLEELIINDNDLAFLPEELGELTKLKRLEVSNNKLRSLPLFFVELTKLELLDVSKNRIIALPNNIGMLRQLKYLYVNNNCLTLLPVSIQEMRSLRILNLSDNQLEIVQAVIGCTNLLELDLSNNKILVPLERLCELTKLERLLLQNNKISYNDEDIRALTMLSHADYAIITTEVIKVVDGFEVHKEMKLDVDYLIEIKKKYPSLECMFRFSSRNLIIQI